MELLGIDCEEFKLDVDKDGEMVSFWNETPICKMEDIFEKFTLQKNQQNEKWEKENPIICDDTLPLDPIQVIYVIGGKYAKI